MIFQKKYIYMILTIVLLSTLCFFSLTFIHKMSNDGRFYLKEGLIKEAVAHFDNMLISRKWNATHGGVFVNETNTIKPNPYLKDNVKLDADGKKMIKINPAWMTRQLSELSNLEGNYYYKITSLKPINPKNVPDSFEKKALEYFEMNKDKKYYYELSEKFDFFGSLKTEKSCLKCHEDQGYKVGDIRGGIRVSIPTKMYNATLKTINEQEKYYSLVAVSISVVFILLLLYIIQFLYIYKTQKNKLIQKGQLLQQAQSIAKLGYLELDFQENELIWSSEVYSIFQLEEGTFQPSYEVFLSLIHPEDKDIVNQVYQDSLKTKLPYEITYKLKMPDNSIKYIIEKHETSFDEYDKPIKSIGTIQDITNIQEVHNEILKKDEIILVQSRHAAMGEMISMIAHQWRQPLGAISMDVNNLLVDIELDNITPESLDTYSKDILTQTEELSNTIDDFSNFFKPNNNLEDRHISTILDDTFKIMEKSLENDNIELNLELIDDVPIKTYPRKLIQVLINIIKNAKDAFLDTGHESKKIFIHTRNNQSKTEIEICDNAGGIKEEYISKIFDPYFSTKQEKDGTGLGLYISKTIIEKHLQGTLIAKNIENGVCFTITLPHILED